ncbi:hypothetical protein [Nocardiopsis sp. CC223A]|uniref:hypothetical protein n=1 Tax=Nocardiopsis sp. CC223A TaxID=3044051 RepID=UPI0027956944|nr:hypothetical protein [Nocardiopsis sp. CC223A]
MNTTARTSAKTLLLAAGAAGFIAFGSGFSWADTLGGVTDGLPLNDLGGQVPTALTEGVGSPVGDLASVQPGTISATPDVQHNSAPTGSLTDGLPVEAPLALDGNSTDVGLDAVSGALPTGAPTVPQSGALDPVTGAVGGLGLLDAVGLNTGGGTLPLSHPAQSPLPLGDTVGQVDGAVTELGAHEVGTGLTELDAASLGEAVPTNDAVMPVNGQNTDISGGAADIVSDLVLGDSAATLPQSAATDPLPELPVALPAEVLPQTGAVEPELPFAVVQDNGSLLVEDAASAEDLVALPLPADVVPQNAPVDALPELPVALPTEVLPQAAPVDSLPELPATLPGLGDVTSALPQSAATDSLPESPVALPAVGDVTSTLPATDSVGGDLVGVNGLPAVGEPTVDGAPLGALA